MPIDPSIISQGIRPVQPLDPMQTLGQVAVMQNQQLQRQEAQQRIAINEAAEKRLNETALLEQAKRRQDAADVEATKLENDQLTDYLMSGQVTADGVMKIVRDPARGTTIMQGIESLRQLHDKNVKDVRATSVQLLSGVEAVPLEVRQQVWPGLREEAISYGMDGSRIPEAYDAGWVQRSLRSLLTPEQQVAQGKPDLKSFPAGQPVYDVNQPLTAGPVITTPNEAPKIGDAAHVIQGLYGDHPTAKQELIGLRMFEDATTAKPQQQRNYQPRMVKVDGTEVQANYDPDTGHYFHPDTGERLRNVQPPDTAEQRNKVAAKRILLRSRDSMTKLGSQIINKVGVDQRADALKRGTEAVFGNDPEFRTYQDARLAYAGTLAVAQQGTRPSDADIKAIWLPMVPDPYRDTAESFILKNNLINDFSDLPPMVAPGAGTSGGGTGSAFDQAFPH